MKTLRIVKKEVGEMPVVMTIEHTLENLQKQVGGYIEVISLGAGIALVINEEGKLIEAEPNFDLGHDVVCGDCFFVGEGIVDGEMDFIDLTYNQMFLILSEEGISFQEPKNEPQIGFEIREWK